jgi:hypothetical protein
LDEITKKEEIAKKLEEYEILKQKMAELEEKAENGENAAQILTNLVHTNQAHINEDGNFMLSEQSASIQENMS